MSINTQRLQRCISALESSLKLYGQAEPSSIDQEVFRNAIVKGFELTPENQFQADQVGTQGFRPRKPDPGCHSGEGTLAYAAKNGCIVITKDKDFGDLVFRDGISHAGVILLRVENVEDGLSALREYLSSGENPQNKVKSIKLRREK